ncbi:unnamed protein product [Zymoseptoria tritici ST99CH_3D7]|uniref:Uncharacterized protein n=1 Tax=Zymoseptoria tritici (strain ST99CH_3D7) TaxID=1276538 RepID=A0A1X7RZB7_ZYMT9|nr:unnamed protein product [Zymoseptoria tritici ST99CH_3D7]
MPKRKKQGQAGRDAIRAKRETAKALIQTSSDETAPESSGLLRDSPPRDLAATGNSALSLGGQLKDETPSDIDMSALTTDSERKDSASDAPPIPDRNVEKQKHATENNHLQAPKEKNAAIPGGRLQDPPLDAPPVVNSNTSSATLLGVPQELRDTIFDMVALNDSAVFCRNTETQTSKCGLLLSDKKSNRDYTAALRRRHDQFPNHRMTIRFNLAGADFTKDLPTIDFALPPCVTGLHLFLQVEKRGLFTDEEVCLDPYCDYDHEGVECLCNIAEPIKASVIRPNLKHLVFEVQVIDPGVVGTWQSRHIRRARDVYKRILHDLDLIQWESNDSGDRVIRHGAVIMHNGKGALHRMNDSQGSVGAYMSPGTLWTRRTVFKKRAVALLDMFHATARVQKGVHDGPRIKSVQEQDPEFSDSDFREHDLTPWSEDESDAKEEHEETKRLRFRYRSSHVRSGGYR